MRKSTITKGKIVLEIGTGKGHLTEVFCRRAKYVYSVEIDRKLYECAEERLNKVSNLKLLCRDFMKYELPGRRNYKEFANIPYYITTQIVKNLRKMPIRPLKSGL